MLKNKLIAGAVFALALMAFTTVSAADLGTTTLKVGSRGAAVTALQQALGVTPVTGYFGPITKAKVQAFQTSKGLTPDGIVGAATKAAINAGTASTGCPAGALFNPTTGQPCSTPTTTVAGCTAGALFSSTTGQACTTTTPSVVTGGAAGDITPTEISTDVESKIIEGQADVKGLGFKVEAVDSDAAITNIKVTFTKDAAVASSYLDRYISDVSVWMNGSKIASVPVSQFTKESSGVYTKSIALSNAIVKEGTSNKATFYIATSGISNIDTDDMDANWTVKVSDFRFVDGTGAILTKNPTSTIENSLDVTDLVNAGDVKLTISKDSSSPVAGNVKVSSTGSTEVPVLALRLKDTGAAINFDALKFALTSDANLNAVLGELILKDGSNELATVSTFDADGSQTVTFDLDETYTIPADSTKVLTVVAKVNDIDNFAQGKYLQVSYANSDFETESSRTSVAETGSAVGENQTFYSEGLNASGFTSSVVTTTDAGVTKKETYTISYKLTAFGQTYYIPKAVTRAATLSNDDTNGLAYTVETSAGAVATAANVPSSASSLTSNASTVSSYFEIPDGETKTFTVTIELTDAGDAPGFYHVQLNQALYDLDQTAVGDNEATYTFAPAQNYETADTKID